jgi:hypothetical protein
MPTTIATGRRLRTAGPRWTAHPFLRFITVDFLLASWALAVLLIGVHACFSTQSPFPGAFDVSVAPF